jgi:hypothetical protein
MDSQAKEKVLAKNGDGEGEKSLKLEQSRLPIQRDPAQP